MNISKKIKKIIMKISNRSKSVDSEILSCPEENADIKLDNSKPRITLLQKRLLWCFIGIALLIGGYYCWQIPVRMQVVAVIPNEYTEEKSIWNPLGLCRWSWPDKADNISVITQYGWDGKVVWSANGPVGVNKLEWGQYDLVCSPDGHVVAIILNLKNKVIVTSWRDGRSLGKVSFLKEHGEYTISYFIDFYATNSGRIWLYSPDAAYCPIKSINGTDIASGWLKMPPSLNDNYTYCFIPDDNVMAVQIDEKLNRVIHYLTLTVEKNKVLVTRKIVHRNVNIYNGYNFVQDENYPEPGFEKSNTTVSKYSGGKVNLPDINNDDGFVDGTNHSLLFSQPSVDAISSLHLMQIPAGVKWNVKTSLPQYRILSGTPDCKNVLVYEENEEVPAFLHSIFLLISLGVPATTSVMERLYDFTQHQYHKEQLTLYSYPGIQKAYFPHEFNYTDLGYCEIVNGYSVSPDGHRIGARLNSKEKYQDIILGW